MPDTPFRLDRDLPIPLGTQLRGRIEGAVAFGELQPGDRLPSVRAMAAMVGVAPMTVAEVYRGLREARLVLSRAGRGTFVADRPPTSEAPQARATLHRRVDALVDQGVALGLGASELAGLVVARMAVRQRRGRTTAVVVVGHGRSAVAAQARSITRILGVRASVTAATMEAVLRDPAVREEVAAAHIVLTLAHHRREVQGLLPGVLVAAVGVIPAQPSRLALASLDPSVRLAAVAVAAEALPAMTAAIRRFAPHVPSVAATTLSDTALAATLAAADVLVYATGAEAVVARLRADTPAIAYRETPDPADVRRVMDPILDEPSAGHPPGMTPAAGS